jgi:PHP family Zn ribbon phosphoesterase
LHTIRAEFHVHSVLSPCAEVEMIPPLIVEEALSLGIGWIAITDHNASANVAAVQQAARGTPLAVLPGMELQTEEEVHLLCLFDTLEQLQSWQAYVDERLPDQQNNPEYFGEQFIVDASGQFIESESRLLINSTRITFNQAVQQVQRRGGLAIPAHVDRRVYGLFANLGFIPACLQIEAVELSCHLETEHITQFYPQLAGYPILQDGDAHRLSELLGWNELLVAEPTLAELRMALAHTGGRQHRIHHNGKKC